jgi:hypothetical protein
MLILYRFGARHDLNKNVMPKNEDEAANHYVKLFGE